MCVRFRIIIIVLDMRHGIYYCCLLLIFIFFLLQKIFWVSFVFAFFLFRGSIVWGWTCWMVVASTFQSSVAYISLIWLTPIDPDFPLWTSGTLSVRSCDWLTVPVLFLTLVTASSTLEFPREKSTSTSLWCVWRSLSYMTVQLGHRRVLL